VSPQLWIGVGFTAALVGFLMITYFVKDRSSPTQYNTLRFLTALCGGFAGGFLAGEALFSLQKEMSSGAKLAISGTAGFALMFTIWFTYPKKVPRNPRRAGPNQHPRWLDIRASRAFYCENSSGSSKLRWLRAYTLKHHSPRYRYRRAECLRSITSIAISI
jgi:hypothetical protein